MEQLIAYIERFVGLDPETIEALRKLTDIETFAKNEMILEPGQRCQRLWFLKSGMVRKFHIHDGSERTSWIHIENDMFTSMQSYARGVPSDEYLQACEPSVAISITRQNSEKLIRFPRIVTFTNAMMERQFVDLDIHTKALATLDAKGKYDYLRQIAPEMTKRAKLGHIASLLGLTPETVSRIRRK